MKSNPFIIIKMSEISLVHKTTKPSKRLSYHKKQFIIDLIAYKLFSTISISKGFNIPLSTVKKIITDYTQMIGIKLPRHRQHFCPGRSKEIMMKFHHEDIWKGAENEEASFQAATFPEQAWSGAWQVGFMASMNPQIRIQDTVLLLTGREQH